MSENQGGENNDSQDQKHNEDEQLRVDELMQISPDDATPEQFAEMQKIAKSSFEQKSSWRSKAIDPESGKPFKDLLAEIKANDESNKETQKKSVDLNDKDETDKRLRNIELSEEKRKFGYKNNLSPEEQDIVFSYANGANTTPDEALKSPFVKSGLEALRKEKDNSDATPNPSFRSPKVGGKTFDEMDKTEKAKSYPDLVKAITSKK